MKTTANARAPSSTQKKGIRRQKKGRAVTALPLGKLRKGFPLPAAAFLHMLDISDRQMSMFLGILFSLVLGLFLGPVHFVVIHRAGYRNGVPDVVRQIHRVTLQFPGGAVIRSQRVVI